MHRSFLSVTLLGFAVLTGSAMGQDSVSKTGTGVLPGDAVDPYDTNDQLNTYVVDLTSFATSWNTSFCTGPILKTNKVDPTFPNALAGAQYISNVYKRNVTFPFNTYDLWKVAGEGVNSNALLNDAPSMSVNVSGKNSHQLAVGFADSGVTAGGSNGNYVVTGIINRRPNQPRRVYVARINTVVNGTNDGDDNGQIGFGSVDADGNTYFRADDFLINGTDQLVGNNIFRVDALARNSGVLNYLNGTSGTSDTGDWLVNSSTDTYNTPCNVPENLFGRPVYVGTNFVSQYAYESAVNTVSTTGAHLGGSSDHRGNVSFSNTIAFPSASPATIGTAALLLKDGANLTKRLGLWGVSATNGAVSSTFSMDFPPTITDKSDGYVFPDGAATISESVHYLSQSSFRGGNGQIALGKDADGKILVATAAASSAYTGADHPWNGISVARFDPANPGGTLEWTMASYADMDVPSGVVNGKAILNGAGGSSIGRMAAMYEFSTSRFGPSTSAPMIDAAGNIWFVGVVALDKPGGFIDFDTALLRAVLVDKANFEYELELVMELGTILDGRNSGLDYQVQFMGIADSNSISSGTAWSGNVVQQGHNGLSVAGLDPQDPRTLGGLVYTADIVYDVNGDGMFDDTVAPDESYQVLMYLGWDGRRSFGAQPQPNDPRTTTGFQTIP